MRTRHGASALAAFTAGLTAAATLRRLAGPSQARYPHSGLPYCLRIPA
jgi:hypothetical protein